MIISPFIGESNFNRYTAILCGLTRVLQFEDSEKPIVVGTTGFFTTRSSANFVMLQGYLLEEFVEHLLPRIHVVEIRTEHILQCLVV